jgi:hypothetical protein
MGAVSRLIAIIMIFHGTEAYCDNSVSAPKNFPKDANLFVEWGTFDTTIANNQNIAIWMKEENNSDTSLSFLSFPLETFELWAKWPDTEVKLGVWISGNTFLPPKTSVFSIVTFNSFGTLNGINELRFAQLVLRTSSPLRILDSIRQVKLLPPDNGVLNAWFLHADSLWKHTPQGKMIPSPTGKSITGGWVSENRYKQCPELKGWLDSLDRNYLSMSAVHANARIFLEKYFCQQNGSFEDISYPNWPRIRAIAQCSGGAANNTCVQSRRNYNSMISSLANLNSRLPANEYYKYRFLSGADTVCIKATSWFDGVGR